MSEWLFNNISDLAPCNSSFDSVLSNREFSSGNSSLISSANSEYAIHQLTNTQRIIRDHGYIDEHYKIFLNISIPDHSHKEPFTSFIWTPDYIKQMQNQWGVIILGYNQVIILTPTNIKLPREEI